MTTYMFPGQGSQSRGMGQDLFSAYPEVVAQADEILGYSIETLCVSDPQQQLNLTEFTQPALYTVNALSYLARIRDGAPKPAYVIGHSLGEYNALHAAGVFDFQTGLRLVARRGRMMGQARNGGMAAVIGMDEEKTRATLMDAGSDDVDIANINSPEQTVISGPREIINRLQTAFEAAGARLYVVLNVSAAFHSRYMADSGKDFARYLATFSFQAPSIPVISNLMGRPYHVAETAALLAGQVTGPVRWCESIRYLMSMGESNFEEIGPGMILSGLVRVIRAQS